MAKSVFTKTTSVPLSRTLGLIQEMLAEHGAQAIMLEYNNGQIEGLSFRLIYKGNFILFKMPCRWREVRKLLYPKYDSYTEKEELQARRVAWRQIFWWLKAQMSMIDAEMVQLAEVFLPFAQEKDGRTLFEKIEANNYKQLTHATDTPKQ